MRTIFQHVIAACLLSLIISQVDAQVPDTISFQGVITDLDGVPIDTSEAIVVRLYKNGVIVWDDKIADVQVVNGRFDLAIGNGALFDTVAFNKPMELEIAGYRTRTVFLAEDTASERAVCTGAARIAGRPGG